MARWRRACAAFVVSLRRGRAQVTATPRRDRASYDGSAHGLPEWAQPRPGSDLTRMSFGYSAGEGGTWRHMPAGRIWHAGPRVSRAQAWRLSLPAVRQL